MLARKILTGKGPMVAAVRATCGRGGERRVPSVVRIESEIAELDETDRGEMLESVGLQEPALPGLPARHTSCSVCKAFTQLARRKFGAWTIPAGATAPQAAGVIHSDFERGFIRVEVYSVDDLVQHRSEKAIREAGKLRLEAKRT